MDSEGHDGTDDLLLPAELKQNYLPIINMKQRPDDVIIMTYPKSGTNFTQLIVWEILNGGIDPPSVEKMQYFEIPFAELVGPDVLKSRDSTRAFMTHIPFPMFGYNSQTKYIYVARNPKDVCVSYYHFIKKIKFLGSTDITFEDFATSFIKSKLPWGNWLEHVRGAYERKSNGNVLFMIYENMLADHRGAVMEIAKFLGVHHQKKLENDPSLLARIVEMTSFDYMKINCTKKDYSSTYEQQTGVKFENKIFFRKGQVGDWRNYFSKEKEEELINSIRSQSDGSKILSLWN